MQSAEKYFGEVVVIKHKTMCKSIWHDEYQNFILRDVPSFLVNALTCSNIDQYKGIIRYAIATRVETLAMDITRQMGSFFGVRQNREVKYFSTTALDSKFWVSSISFFKYIVPRVLSTFGLYITSFLIFQYAFCFLKLEIVFF